MGKKRHSWLIWILVGLLSLVVASIVTFFFLFLIGMLFTMLCTVLHIELPSSTNPPYLYFGIPILVVNAVLIYIFWRKWRGKQPQNKGAV